MIVGLLVYFWTKTFIGMRVAVFESIFLLLKYIFLRSKASAFKNFLGSLSTNHCGASMIRYQVWLGLLKISLHLFSKCWHLCFCFNYVKFNLIFNLNWFTCAKFRKHFFLTLKSLKNTCEEIHFCRISSLLHWLLLLYFNYKLESMLIKLFTEHSLFITFPIFKKFTA